MAEINFTTVAKNAIVLSGKEKGINTRREFSLDNLDNENVYVDVILPETLEIISPSFVAGMFAPSVRKTGSVDAFFQKYRFKTTPRVLEQIRDAARSSLLTASALSNISKN